MRPHHFVFGRDEGETTKTIVSAYWMYNIAFDSDIGYIDDKFLYPKNATYCLLDFNPSLLRNKAKTTYQKYLFYQDLLSN